jgi:hypothetical protein
MKQRSQPYQPLLLRILHGCTGSFLLAAMATAFWTYDTYDGRWGRIFLPRFPEIEGIHGTLGLLTLLVFPLFAVYAFRSGKHRLIPTAALGQLFQASKAWRGYTLHRLTNTITLLALTFALFSGKMMDSTWLPKGELNHGWYYAHLMAWVVMALCIVVHLLMIVKVGGTPLLLSIWNFRVVRQDSPAGWPEHMRQWWHQVRCVGAINWVRSTFKFNLEMVVLITIAASWVIPILKYRGG